VALEDGVNTLERVATKALWGDRFARRGKYANKKMKNFPFERFIAKSVLASFMNNPDRRENG
jgi:hypothetical protein